MPGLACPHGLPAARTCPFLATTAGATAAAFKNTTGSPARIFSVPATTSAGRSPSCAGAPPFSGETRHRSGTATMTPGRKIPLISGNTGRTAGGRVRRHRGSL